MDIFEYVSVLTSIIVGLGIAHLLRGVVRLIQHPGRHPVYWVHLGWVANMFLSLVFFWWWEFNLGGIERWTFTVYLFVLCYAVLLFMISALLFPEDLSGYEGYREYFHARRRWFFGLQALTFPIDVVDTMIKGSGHVTGLGSEYLPAMFIQFSLAIFAMFIRNERFHQVLVVAFLAYQLSWALRMFGTVA